MLTSPEFKVGKWYLSLIVDPKTLKSQKKLVSVSEMMTGKFLQIPKVFGNPDDLKSVRMIWKVSGWSEKCPNYLKSARMICKASGQSERCPNDLGNVQMMHKMCFTLFLHILPNKDSDSFFDWSKLLLKVSSFSDAETPNNYFWDLYTLIWTIQTLRRGKVIFKCICIESLLETHNELLS